MNISHEIKHIGTAGWLRISIVIVLIMTAYMAGLAGGKHRGYHDAHKMYEDTHGPMMPETMGGDDMNHSMMRHDPMQMSMADMGQMLEGKTGAALNKAFLEGMIPHHQGAIEIAKYLANSDKPELVQLGGEIITAQSKEIDQMKAWLIEWGYTSTGITATGATDMMREHCQMMPGMPGCEEYR